MILETAEPDKDVVDLALAELPRLREMPRLKLDTLDPDTAALIAPHHVYVLRLDEILQAKDAMAALIHARRPVATRFLVRDATHVVAAVEVGDATGSGLAVNTGDYVSGTVFAIELAEQRDDPPIAEMRLLRVPALHLTALWLSAADHADLLIPLDPAPPPLDANEFYTPLELVAQLISLAVSRFATDGVAGVLGSIDRPPAGSPAGPDDGIDGAGAGGAAANPNRYDDLGG
jgi:hypothetical protein